MKAHRLSDSVVEPLESRIAPASFTVTTTADSGAGSLRQAILDANAASGPDTINFNISGAGVHAIALLTPLPALSGGLLIDGRTEPGYAGAPLIELDGSAPGAAGDGLVLSAFDTVFALDIHSFSGHGVRIDGIESAVRNCWIGLDATGTAAAGNGGSGVFLTPITGNLTSTITRTIDANVIAGNARFGVEDPGEVTGGDPVRVIALVSNNHIGTNVAGDAALGNALGGVFIFGARASASGNLISGNGGTGLFLHLSGKNTYSVANNIIGLNAAGTAALPNHGSGIDAGLSGNAVSSGGTPYLGSITIGGAGGRNVISGNTGAGISASGSVIVSGNYIGLDALGATAIGNGGAGVEMAADFLTVTGNVISGNGGAGVVLGSVQSAVTGNKIGSDAAGTTALGNAGDGIRVTNGGQGYGGGGGGWTIQPNTATGNLIANNGGDGIAVVQTGKAYLVQNTLLANAGLGIHLTDQGNNLIAAPVLSSAAFTASGLAVAGSYDGTPSATRILHFYANTSAGAEAETYLGTATITTNAAGHADFNATFNASVPAGATIVATASHDATAPGITSVRTAYTSQLSAAVPAAIGVTIGDVAQVEGDSGTSNFVFTVTLSVASASPITVDFQTANGTATAGSDFTATSGTLTFAPGETTKSIVVSVNGDLLYEGDETFALNLSNPTGATITDGLGLGTILNDDTPPQVSIGDATVTEGDAGTKLATFTVSLDAASGSAASVSYNTSGGSALAGSDYVAASGSVVFAPGETSKTISVTINGDTAIEADETFHVLLSNPTGATIADGDGLGTILNDDVPQVSIGDATLTEGDAGTKTATFTVSLDAAGVSPATVFFQTSNGSALAGSDYVAASGSVVFAPGETSKAINVTINGDTAVEPDETFHVLLTNPSGATIADGDGLGTILNDDAPPPLPHVSIGDTAVAEGDTGTKLATFTVSLDAASANPATVFFQTANDTAQAGSDYVAASGSVVFAPGETSKTISVTINGDTAVEPDETFQVLLTSATGAVIADGDGLGTILNDDAPPPPVVSVSADHMNATWLDEDGDFISLHATKPILSAGQFQVTAGTSGGLQVDLLDLSGAGAAASGVGLTFKTTAGPTGDGRFALGGLDASGIDLGKVSLLTGNLVRIIAGDSDPHTPGVAKLTVLSLGYYLVPKPAGTDSAVSDITGSLTSLIVKGGIADAAVRVHGNGAGIKSASLGESLIATATAGPTGFFVDGVLGRLTVHGGIQGADAAHRVELFGAAAIKSLHVYGNVESTDIAAGYDADSQGGNGSARIGSVTIDGSLLASNLAAGISHGADGVFGTSDDHRMPLTSALISRISRITVRGAIEGTAGVATDHFGIFAQEIGALYVGGVKLPLIHNHIDHVALGTTGDVDLREFA